MQAFCSAAVCPPNAGSYVTLPDDSHTLNDFCRHTQCKHGNTLTYVGLVWTAARHCLNQESASSFIKTLNDILSRRDCCRTYRITTEEHTLVFSVLILLKTYELVKHHVIINIPADPPLSMEDLLQSDIHHGIALIEFILPQAKPE